MKWTKEEEVYTARIIHDFEAGLLPLNVGAKLGPHLMKLLNCEKRRLLQKKTFKGKLNQRV